MHTSMQVQTYLQLEGVQGPVRGAVEGSLRGELQGVEEPLALEAEGAAQLKHSLADVAGAIVHQLKEEIRKWIRRVQEHNSFSLDLHL